MTTLPDQSENYNAEAIQAFLERAEANRHRIAALMDELTQALANWQAAAQERDVALSNAEAAEKENRLLRATVQSLESKL